MCNILAIKFYCKDCNMEYEVKYDDDKFIRPTYCAACGSDKDLIEEN